MKPTLIEAISPLGISGNTFDPLREPYSSHRITCTRRFAASMRKRDDFDHRVLDGYQIGGLATALRQILEQEVEDAWLET